MKISLRITRESPKTNIYLHEDQEPGPVSSQKRFEERTETVKESGRERRTLESLTAVSSNKNKLPLCPGNRKSAVEYNVVSEAWNLFHSTPSTGHKQRYHFPWEV